MAKIITLKYAGKCVQCGSRVSKGKEAMWLGRGEIQCCGYADMRNHDQGGDMLDAMNEEASERWYSMTYGNERD